jgi:hypothetical protein
MDNEENNIDNQIGNKKRLGNPAWHHGMESPNKEGRPPKIKCVKDAVRRVADEPSDDNVGTRLDDVIRTVFVCARNGEGWAANFIADRLDGKATQSIEIEDTTEQPQRIVLGGREIVINA